MVMRYTSEETEDYLIYDTDLPPNYADRVAAWAKANGYGDIVTEIYDKQQGPATYHYLRVKFSTSGEADNMLDMFLNYMKYPTPMEHLKERL